MERAIQVLVTVVPVIGTIVAGVVIRKINLLSQDHINAIRRLIINVMMPAMMIKACAGAEYTPAGLLLPMIMYVICIAALGLGVVGKKVMRIRSPYAPSCMPCYEIGMLGYALYGMLFGSENTADLALMDIGQVLFIFTLYKTALSKERGEPMALSGVAKDLFSSPGVWGIIIGVILGATGLFRKMGAWGGDQILNALTGFISAPTGMLILLTIGYELKLEGAQMGDSVKIVLTRLLVSGLILCAVLPIFTAILPRDPYIRPSVIMSFILPTTFGLPVFADDPRENANLSSTLCLMTLVSIALFVVVTILYG